MKRFFSVTLVMLLLFSLSVPAFADTAADTPYIPEIPPFLTVSGNKVTINTEYDKNSSSEITAFFKDFYDDGYLILVEQWRGYASKQKTFWLTFVKLNSSSTSSDIGGFRFTGGTSGMTTGSGAYYIAPVSFYPPASGCTMVNYYYDAENKCFSKPVSTTVQSSALAFSYVIESSALSGTSQEYPYRSFSAGHPFSVVYDKPRHYDWWLTINGGMQPPVTPPDINLDTDGDGKPDVNIDTNGDGKPDVNIDTNGDKKPDVNVDTNGDGRPDVNIDTNGDGKPDVNIDTNGDKKPDVNVDTNGDGKPDVNIDTNGDNRPDVNVDTNGDNKPDINVDTNGDGKPDINIDTNGDKRPDVNIDKDGDKKPDINVDNNGDKKPDVNVDTNGDGKPDINIDTNGDGKPDVNIDTNGDGKPDTNLKPDGGGSSGGDSGGSGSGGSGGGYGDDWFDSDDDDKDLTYNDFPIFDPFSYDNYTPPAYNNPFTDYNPLEGYESYNYMPEIPRPKVDPWDGYDPFKNPYK